MFFFIKGNNVRIKLLDIESRPLLRRLGHRKQFDIYSEGLQVIGTLLGHRFIALRTRVIFISEEEDSLVVTLFLNTLELLVTNPKCLEEWHLESFPGMPEILAESCNALFYALNGSRIR